VPKLVPRVIFELGPEAPSLASEQGMQVRHLHRPACPGLVYTPLGATAADAASVDL